MYLTERLYVGMSVGCFHVTSTLSPQLKSAMIYSVALMTLVRIVNFLMEMCRSFTCDIAASFEVSWKG